MAASGANLLKQHLMLLSTKPAGTRFDGPTDSDSDVPKEQLKRLRSSAAVKTEPPAQNSGRGTQPSTASRSDNGLGHLTRKFVSLLHDSPSGMVDVNQAAEDLQVQPRRITDIINVLGGVGLIEKKGKYVQWAISSHPRLEPVQADIKSLQELEADLDEHILRLSRETIALGERDAEHLFVTGEDIRSIPSFMNDKIMAVKAPPSCTLDPNSDESTMPYKCRLSSTTGPIKVFAVHNYDCGNSMGQPQQQEVAQVSNKENLFQQQRQQASYGLQNGQAALLTPSRVLLDHSAPSPSNPVGSCTRSGFCPSPRNYPSPRFNPSPRRAQGVTTPREMIGSAAASPRYGTPTHQRRMSFGAGSLPNSPASLMFGGSILGSSGYQGMGSQYGEMDYACDELAGLEAHGLVFDHFMDGAEAFP